MADYPGAIPTLATVSSSDPIEIADFNDPNREIEAICTELGANPKTILDTVTPGSAPDTVAAVLDMMANIVKNIAGAPRWYNSAVGLRNCVCGHGGGEVVPDWDPAPRPPGDSGERWVFLGGGAGLTGDFEIEDAHYVVPFDCVLRPHSFYFEILEDMASDNALHVAIMKWESGDAYPIDQYYGIVSKDMKAGVYRLMNTPRSEVFFPAHSTILVRLANYSSTTDSAPIGALGFELDQVG